MSAANVTVRYDGPILANHRMDVADLAPALLGISELCKIANKKFNGERASVQVLIGTDVEHKCFQIKLEVLQTLWDVTKGLLANDNVKSAKELLELLGLLGFPTGVGVGLFHLLKKLRGRKISSTTIESIDGRDVVRVTIEGDNNTVLVVPSETLDLMRDPDAVASAKKVVLPLVKDGYESVEFEPDGALFAEKIDKAEALDITRIDPAQIEPTEKDAPQVINAWISVYSPVYDTKSKAPKWRFKFGDAHEYMDISETDIADAAIRRGGAMIDDAYYVQLEITQEHKPTGSIINIYRIKKVLDFKQGRVPHQTDAFKDHGHGHR